MYKDLAERWADDLEANPDTQGKGSLCTTDGKFCCLGRLALLVGVKFDPNGYPILPNGTKSYSGTVLPLSYFGELTGMKNGSGAFKYSPDDPDATLLTELNDEGMPFQEIAKIIRTFHDQL